MNRDLNPEFRPALPNVEKLMIRLRVLAVATAVLPAILHPQSSVAQAPAPAAPVGVTAFVDVNVVPMNTERVLPNQTVLVEGGRITALGPSTKIKVPASAARVDGRGKFLIPGLADMHVHFEKTDIVSDSLNWPLLAFLAHGVTTVRNLRGNPWHVELRERVAKGEVLGPRIYTTGPQVTQRYFNSLATDGTSIGDAAAKLVAEHRTIGYDFLKLWGEAAAIDRPIFDTLAALAKQAGVRIVGHTPLRGVGLERMLQGQAASIEHLSGYMNRIGQFPDSLQEKNVESILDRFPLDESKIPALAAATKQAGVWNCPTMLIYKHLFQHYYKDEKAPQYIALRGKVVKALHEAGAGLLLCTDVVAKGMHFNWPVYVGSSVHDELQLLVEAGLTPYQALEIGTRNTAMFLGTLDSTGTLEVGKRADLVLLHGNPVQDIRNTAQSAGVMIGGRWLPREELDRRLAEMKAPVVRAP
jgi:hypothetical protein